MKLKRFSVYDIALISVFVAVISVCSFITIPFTVPLTMQVFGVFLAVGLLGGKRAVACVVAYILLGAVGAPVFASFQGGVQVLLGQTGGFLLGFVLSAVVSGVLIKLLGTTLKTTLLAMLAGLLACYLCGITWLVLVYSFNILSAVAMCVPLLVFDVAKVVVASVLTIKLGKYVR